VLNAFRHQRVHRIRVRQQSSLSAHPCSTPFGIRGFIASIRGCDLDVSSLCSTPFGIRGFIARRSDCNHGGGGQVLNAFRHQRVHRLAPILQRLHVHVVLNAFRHQRVHRSAAQAGSAAISLVLNAFRHQRVHRPFLPVSRWAKTSSAQRLSASEGSSQYSIVASVALTLACSTPFGIRGFIATEKHGRGSECVHCAQRLSASEGSSRPEILKVHPPSEGAQRLSASEGSSRLHLPGGSHHVLEVLNAFRHQRVHRRCRRCSQSRLLSCSTPFGIRGFIARCRRRRAREAQAVLNAFRHQRVHRSVRSSNTALGKLCSTPFGIRGFIAICSALEILAIPLVLNAFRHQRVHRSPRPPPTAPRSVRAQRLSASEGSSQIPSC